MKRILRKLGGENIPLREIYLFGSFIKKDIYNDIDIALISDQFSGIRFYDIEKILSALKRFPSIYDFHPFNTNEFLNEDNVFADEIRRTGKKIMI